MINKVFAAMDVSNFDEFLTKYNDIKGAIQNIKVGYQLFYSEGDKVLNFLKNENKNIFLDLKFDDIPNTIEKGFLSLVKKYKFHFFTVHCGVGKSGLQKLAKIGKDYDVKILAVTVLTSLDQKDLQDLGIDINISLSDLIQKRISLAQESGVDGIILSAADLENKFETGNLIKITPGIKYFDDVANDQKRITTPRKAFELGADYIVMGRSLFKHGITRLKKELV